MTETEVSASEVFKNATGPYGIPVIVFPSKFQDSRIYMAQGHLPPNRLVKATGNWIFRHNGIIFLVPRDPKTFLEWGFARFYKLPDDGNVETFRIDLFTTDENGGIPVSFFEV